jgi:RimJ/RimL family protein N-acetyltransferase
MRDDEAILMPAGAPRPALCPPSTPAAGGPDRRYGPDPNEREYSLLRQQLGALEHDIAAARGRLREASDLHLRPGREIAPPRPRGEAVVLPDGARILIRPVEPGDAPVIRAAFEHLADVSRYRRFLSPIEHLSLEQLDYLTHVDHDRHEALGALDPSTGEGLGIARYVRDARDATQAEVAVTVADAWQGRGVGAALAERLADRARAADVERFTARLLIGNHAARRLLERVAEPIGEREDGGTVRVTARLRR